MIEGVCLSAVTFIDHMITPPLITPDQQLKRPLLARTEDFFYLGPASEATTLARHTICLRFRGCV